MKVLHIFSNWKWTGPAEHALNIAAYLASQGHHITFACAAPPLPVEDSLVQRAERTGLPLVRNLRLNKHFHPGHDALDCVRLAGLMRKESFDLIHTHLLNDHLIAALGAGLSRSAIPIVRSAYDGSGLPPGARIRWLLRRHTDLLITVSEASRTAINADFGFPPDRMRVICPGVDCARFAPSIDGTAVRQRYGIPAHYPVLGIVARVQRHRRFEIFIDALRRAVREEPRLRALIIGRGTHIEEVAVQPVRRLGLGDHVIFTGYQLEGYPELLAAVDFKLFLVPGSDGSCRAVREAMAMGKPLIVARRGILPELVTDGVTGLVVDDTAENIAGAMLTLVRDVPLRRKMGDAARRKALTDFSLEGQTEKIEGAYRECLRYATC